MKTIRIASLALAVLLCTFAVSFSRRANAYSSGKKSSFRSCTPFEERTSLRQVRRRSQRCI